MGSDEEISYAFLVLATGCSQSSPAKLSSNYREEACEELQKYQKSNGVAERVAIVVRGAVGVERVADVKRYYPEKHLTFIDSRDQLLSGFEPRLCEHVLRSVGKLGVGVLLNERPYMAPSKTSNGKNQLGGTKSLTWKNGSMVEFDFVVGLVHIVTHSPHC